MGHSSRQPQCVELIAFKAATTPSKAISMGAISGSKPSTGTGRQSGDKDVGGL